MMADIYYFYQYTKIAKISKIRTLPVSQELRLYPLIFFLQVNVPDGQESYNKCSVVLDIINYYSKKQKTDISPLPHNAALNTLRKGKKRLFESSMAKGENAGISIFSFSHCVFYPI